MPNKQSAIDFVQSDGLLFADLSEEWQQDRDVVLAAVRTTGTAYRWVKKPLSLDEEIAVEAMRKNGDALWMAPTEMKDNYHVVLTAIQNKPRAISHASLRLKQNRDIILAALKDSTIALEHIKRAVNIPELAQDIEVVYHVLKAHQITHETLRDQPFAIDILPPSVLAILDAKTTPEQKTEALANLMEHQKASETHQLLAGTTSTRPSDAARRSNPRL